MKTAKPKMAKGRRNVMLLWAGVVAVAGHVSSSACAEWKSHILPEGRFATVDSTASSNESLASLVVQCSDTSGAPPNLSLLLSTGLDRGRFEGLVQIDEHPPVSTAMQVLGNNRVVTLAVLYDRLVSAKKIKIEFKPVNGRSFHFRFESQGLPDAAAKLNCLAQSSPVEGQSGGATSVPRS